VAWSSEKIKTILGGFLFFGRTWPWQNKFIVKKNNMKVFILKIND
jgi:hypothetical protein